SLAGAPDSDSDARSPSSLSLSLSPAPGSTRSFPQAGASESEKTRGTMGRRTGPCYANLEGSLVSRRVAISVDVLALGPELDRRAQAVEQRDRFVGQEIVVDADPLEVSEGPGRAQQRLHAGHAHGAHRQIEVAQSREDRGAGQPLAQLVGELAVAQAQVGQRG